MICLTFDSDHMDAHVANSSSPGRELFYEGMRAFLNFELQPGWPTAHFTNTLVVELLEVGALEGAPGDLIWEPDILFLDGVLEVPWDPDPLFWRICHEEP